MEVLKVILEVRVQFDRSEKKYEQRPQEEN